MRRQWIVGLVLGSGLLLTAGAYAQGYGDPYYRGGGNPNGYGNDPRYRGGYSRGERAGGSVLDRARGDLERAASDSYYMNGHERDHFRHAMQELDKFQNRLERGKWDNGAIDRAIENIAHLANADRIRPRDRQILNSDLYALREFRASRGYSNGGGYGYGPRY